MNLQASHRAFTIIELMTVITIMGLLSGIAVLSLRSVMAVKERGTLVQEWLSIDSETRLRAKRFHQPMYMKWDAQTNTLTYGPQGEGSEQQEQHRFPSRYRIQLIPDQDRNDLAVNQVLINKAGRSLSYQVLVHDEQGYDQYYILGLTGEVIDLTPPQVEDQP